MKRPARRAAKTVASSGSRTNPAVDEFLRRLNHPLASDLEAVRRLILDVNPRVGEDIKWNAPSFRTRDFFATLFLRSKDRVQVILHQGAKVKDNSTKGVELPDPRGLVQWLAKERCLVTIGAGKEIAANRAAFAAILRAWIRQL